MASTALESFLNARYSKPECSKRPDSNLFGAEDQIIAVEEINFLLEKQGNVIDKFLRSEGHLSALKSLASVNGVPTLLRTRIIELSQIVPLLRLAMENDLKWKWESSKIAPLASDDESVALIVSWRDSAIYYTSLFDRLYALIV
jgi:hypothetical protein